MKVVNKCAMVVFGIVLGILLISGISTGFTEKGLSVQARLE